MKKRSNLFYALLCSLLLSCGYHDNNTSISYRDKDQYYSMNANFSEKRMRTVERYMNERIGRKNNISFSNTQTNAMFTLDDGTKFHMEKYPGHIEIKLDKTENTHKAYRNIKEMCEGMKNVILK
jgi:acetoin utilization deacetylase AcuC-like enzyme